MPVEWLENCPECGISHHVTVRPRLSQLPLKLSHLQQMVREAEDQGLYDKPEVSAEETHADKHVIDLQYEHDLQREETPSAAVRLIDSGAVRLIDWLRFLQDDAHSVLDEIGVPRVADLVAESETEVPMSVGGRIRWLRKWLQDTYDHSVQVIKGAE